MTPTTGTVEANGLEFAYEAFGDPEAASIPIVMVMGLATQMIAWPVEMCAALADAGHYVVRYDNRDVGLSSHLDHLGVPTLFEALRGNASYRLSDMADDCVGVLDGLGIDQAYLVGASMGGFISQTVAIRHPQRVAGLTLIMTSTGSRLVGRPKLRILPTLLRDREAGSREAAIQMALDAFAVIGSPGYPSDEGYIREMAGRSYDRSHSRRGVARQLSAVLTQPNRTERLAAVKVPTTVLHGLEDPLVRPSGGIAVARAIPGSRFVGYPGMGHSLPRELWPAMVDEILGVAGH